MNDLLQPLVMLFDRVTADQAFLMKHTIPLMPLQMFSIVLLNTSGASEMTKRKSGKEVSAKGRHECDQFGRLLVERDLPET